MELVDEGASSIEGLVVVPPRHHELIVVGVLAAVGLVFVALSDDIRPVTYLPYFGLAVIPTR